jgi:hypothetical protein
LQFASIPVPKKKNSSDVVWRGAFLDYETAVTYLYELTKSGDLTPERYSAITDKIAAHLNFAPQIVTGISYTTLYPFGQHTVGDWLSNYAPASALSPSSFFKVPDPKPKTEKPARYNVFEANASKGAISTEGVPITGTCNNIQDGVSLWEMEDGSDPKTKAFSFLITVDGHKPPQQAIVAQMPTPQAQAKFLGLSSAKGGNKTFVYKNTKTPAAPAVKKEKPVKTEKVVAEGVTIKVAPAKKRKTTEATA